MDPTPIANGLATNPLAWGLAIALLTIAYLYRQLTELQAKFTEAVRADAKEQREILEKIVPLAAKLTEGLELLERLTDSVAKG